MPQPAPHRRRRPLYASAEAGQAGGSPAQGLASRDARVGAGQGVFFEAGTRTGTVLLLVSATRRERSKGARGKGAWGMVARVTDWRG